MGFYPDNKAVAAIPTAPSNVPGLTQPEAEVIQNADEQLTNRKYVVNTMNNATGVNHERLNAVVETLKGFAEGSEVTVTYYKEHYSETDLKGRLHATEDVLHPAHKSMLKIMGFKMKLTTPLSYTHEVEQQSSELTGEALTYPGFAPESGDRFILEIDTGKYGLMQIIKPPERMSIRAATYFKISFGLVEYMSEEQAATLDEAVVDIAWFDKLRFLNEPGALLTHDEYVEMNYLTKQKAKMIHFHKAKFYDGILMYSYMRPDKIYDPYIVKFILDTLDYTDVGSLATQLFPTAPFLDTSFWEALRDENIPLEAVPVIGAISTYVLGSKSVLANSLLNKEYTYFTSATPSLADYLETLNDEGLPKDDDPDQEVEPGDEGSDTCNHSCAFGGVHEFGGNVIPASDPNGKLVGGCNCTDPIVGDTLLHLHPHYHECPLVGDEEFAEYGELGAATAMFLGTGDHFKLMKQYLLTREINLKLLHDLIAGIWKLSPMEQFYRMPIYIFLANRAVLYIRHDCGIYERAH